MPTGLVLQRQAGLIYNLYATQLQRQACWQTRCQQLSAIAACIERGMTQLVRQMHS